MSTVVVDVTCSPTPVKTVTGTREMSWRTAAKTASTGGIWCSKQTTSTPAADKLAQMPGQLGAFSCHRVRVSFTVRRDFMGRMTYVTPVIGILLDRNHTDGDKLRLE